MEVKALNPKAQVTVPAPAENNAPISPRTNSPKGENLSPQVSREYAEELSGVMNKIASLENIQLQFEVYQETNTVYVQIVDRETKEVVKQIPPEEMLELSAKIREMVGILLDEYV